jgi:hypothetical protein
MTLSPPPLTEHQLYQPFNNRDRVRLYVRHIKNNPGVTGAALYRSDRRESPDLCRSTVILLGPEQDYTADTAPDFIDGEAGRQYLIGIWKRGTT